MRRVRKVACVLAAGLVLAAAGCGNDNPAAGVLDQVDMARARASTARLQTVLVTVAPIRQELQNATASELAAAAQGRDRSHSYSTAAPGDAGAVQVVGGGEEPVMLVMFDPPPTPARAPVYVAAWQGDGVTAWYEGPDPPSYAIDHPTGPGWSPPPTT